MSLQTSIVIRTKNEGQFFHQVLKKLKEQTYQDFEVVVVDDNSEDGTESLVRKYFSKNRIQVVHVPKGKFTHPYSTNIGADAARGKLIVIINGHSIPISRTWLKEGINHFQDDKVAGVFAFTLANPQANLTEKFLYNLHAHIFHNQKRVYHQARMGILGTTNAIIRKDLWQKYNFDEKFCLGGEDNNWAKHWLNKGYVIIQDPGFRVYHSHNLSLLGLIKQLWKWHQMRRPSDIKPKLARLG